MPGEATKALTENYSLANRIVNDGPECDAIWNDDTEALRRSLPPGTPRVG